MNNVPVSTTTLRWAVWVLAVHATGVLVLAALLTWAAFTAPSISTTSEVATPLVALFFAAVFAGLAVALHQMRGWARGPAIVLEMLLLPIGYSVVRSDIVVIGVLVVLSGLIGAGMLLAPTTRGALGLNRQPGGGG